MNKKGSSWWAWFFVILFILFMTSIIRISIFRHSMYDDITGNVIDERDYVEPQTQQEQVTKQQEAYPSRQGQVTQTTDYEQTQNQEQSEEAQESISPSCLSGYIKEYRCEGSNIQQEYQYVDCNVDWVKVKFCEHGCADGKCNPAPCEEKRLDEYKCEGNLAYQKYQYSDCDTIWRYKEGCQYGCADGKCSPEPQIRAVTVSYVLDGDTFKLSTGETVRLIGLNAPESGQSCSSEATAKLKEFVFGKEIRLEKDIDDKDQYGRLLRYVYVDDGVFVNSGMIWLGFAHKYEYGSNTKYSSLFEQAENEAKQNEGCLWKSEEVSYIQDKCTYITNFHFNAAGDDNYNLNDEYVIKS